MLRMYGNVKAPGHYVVRGFYVPVSDRFQNLILVAPVVNDTEHHDILFLLIDQVIGNIILHQDAPRPSFRLNI